MKRRALGSGLTLVAGAGVYALVTGVAGATFAATPLALGIIAIVAGIVGTRHRVVGTGVVLAGWGVAVAAFTGPLVLYLSYDLAAFGRWPLWALALLAWAGWELFWGLRSTEPTVVSRAGA